MRRPVVTTIPKKGKKLLLKNERGIFIVNGVRNILMRLLFKLKSQTLENHKSDSNVGGRRKKSGINHIWVIKSKIHDNLISCKKLPIIKPQYDFRQMFDGMDAKQACGDIYDYGINNDHLNLI